jgi:uncharacterized protein (DUF302 family)
VTDDESREAAVASSIAFEARLQDGFDGAVEKVTAALKAEGFGILTRIDVHTTLKEKLGAEFRPYAILGACNPPLAHRALSHNAEVGLLLPCNVTVEADPAGGSIARIGDPQAMLAVGGFRNDLVFAEVAAEARGRLQRVAAALRSR